MKTHTFWNVLVAISFLFFAGCGKGNFDLDSISDINTDEISLSLASSNVSWNGSKLVGQIDLKASNAKGIVQGYTPQVSVVSTNSVSNSFFSKMKTAFYSVVPSLKPDLTTQSTIVYTVLPCSVSNEQGLSSCKVEVNSGTGEIYLQIAGSKTTTPLELRLVINPHPQLNSVSPAFVESGLVKSTITISGNDFRSPLKIKVGSIDCENVVVNSATQATCDITTDKSLGLKDISITNPDLQYSLLSGVLEFKDTLSPTLTVSQKPASLVNSSAANIVFSAQDTVTATADLTFSCLLDGASQTCATSPVSLSGLSEGPHSLLIQVSDSSGNSSSEHINWTVDTIAPTVLINNAQLGSSPSAITTARTVSFSGADVVRYKALVSRNQSCAGLNFSSVSETDVATSFTLNISTDGTYNICAIGRDAAGNWQSTATLSSTLTIDTSIPYIVDIAGNLTSPSNNSTARTLTLSGNSTQAYKAVTLKDSTDCSTVDFSAVSESVMSATYSLTFSGDDAYTVCAIGRNSSNVWQTTPSHSSVLVIDTVPSSLAAFSLGASPSSSNATRSIYFSGTDIVQWKAQTLSTSSCDLTALNASAASPVASAYSLVTATDGTYYVCAIGMDSAGNWQASATVGGPLVVDTTAPVLTKTSPASGTSFQGSVTVVGTCENGLTVSVAGSPASDISAPSSMTCASGAFSLNISLAGSDGSKSLVLSSTDAAANTSTVSFSLLKDTTAPALAFTNPAAGTAGKNGLTIEGTCEVNLPITLSGAGLTSPTSATCVNGVFSEDIVFTAVDGNKVIEIAQADGAGNNTTATRTFVKDATGPVLTIASPAANTSAKNGVTLAGTCEEGLSIALSGSGLASPASTTCATGGNFSVAVIFSATDGTKTISVSQTDLAGNITTVSRDFIRDNVAPAFTFASTAIQNQSNNLNYVNFSGACETGATITVKLNSVTDGTTDCADGVWLYRTASQVTDATRHYTLTAADAAGNETALVGSWVRDATAPSLSLTSAPAAGAILAGGASINIGWTGSDPHINDITDFPIQLKYSVNGGTTWAALAGPLMNSGSYSWNLPSVNSSAFKIQVVMTDSFGNEASVESGAFTVDSSAPIVTLTSLTGGQLLKGGVAQSISWSLQDANLATNAVSLKYSLNNGAWQDIVTSITNSGASTTGSYSWTPTADGSYIIKVQAIDKGGLVGEASSASAVIVDATAPALSDLKLNGAISGVIVAASSTITISWTTSDNNFGSYPMTLFYSINNGTSWTSMGAAVAATPSSSSWNITSLAFPDGDNYRVKVVATDRVGNFTETMTNAFSVRSSAPALNFAASVNTNYYSNTNSVTYSGTCTNGYAITVTGPDASNPAPTCTGGNWSWSTDTVSTDQVRAYTFAQSNGALSTSISATWTRDTQAPAISSFTINSGATSTSVPNLALAAAATDANSAAGLRYQLVMASIVTQTCPSVGSTWTAFPGSGSLSRNSVVTSPNGQKTFCLWVADAAGNIASASRAITFNAGTIPQINSLSVTNGLLGSNYGTSKYNTGDTVKISWSVHDNEELATNPIYLDVTTDGSTWTPLENGYGNLAAGSKDYNYNYTGYSAPSGFFRIRIRAKDASGNWSYSKLSSPQSAGQWTIIAGSMERGIGSSPTSASLATSTYGGGMVAINPANGDIYAIDKGYGIVKITAATNLVSKYVSEGTANFSSAGGTITSSTRIVSGDASVVFDGGYLYILVGGGTTVSSKIFRVNPADNTYTLYLGGGTNTAAGTSSTSAFVIYDMFRFDEDHALYYFTSCASPVSSYNSSTHTVRLMRVAQDENGNAKTTELIAGQCTTPAEPTVGSLADATPLGLGTGIGVSDFAVWDHGNSIYYRLGQSTKVFKVINNAGTRRIYGTNLSGTATGGLARNKSNGLLYYATNKVEAWNPTTTESSETSAGLLAATAGAGANCSADEVDAATESCVRVKRLITSEDQVFLLDGSNTDRKNYRIRFVDGTGKIFTVAGSQGFIGDGGPASLSRGQFRGLAYKNSTLNLTAFPNGLYLSDPISDSLSYIDDAGTIRAIWGNQTSTCVSSYSSPISTGESLGCSFGLPNVANQNILFDRNGLLWTRNAWARLSHVQANKTVTQKTTAIVNDYATSWMYVDPASYNPGNVNYYYAFSSNMTMKDTTASQDTSTSRQGFFSLGGFRSGSTWPYNGAVLRFMDFKKNQIIHIMGSKDTAASTADIATNTDLSTTTLSTSCMLTNDNSKSPCYIRFVENDATIDTDDELYFVEGNLLRVITNPLNPGAQTLKTLMTETNTIHNFILAPDFAENLNNRRIYYVSNGLLYCFAVDKKSENADCKNRKGQVTTMADATYVQKHNPLGPPTGMLSLTSNSYQMADSMAWKDSKTLFIANGSGEIYQYNVPQPTETTKNLIWGVNALTRDAATNYPDAAASGAKITRVTVGYDGTTASWDAAVTKIKNAVSPARSVGMQKISIILAFDWMIAPTNIKTFAAAYNEDSEEPAIYNKVYTAAYYIVSRIKDETGIIIDIELLNEPTLKAAPGENATWNVAWDAADWENRTNYGSTRYWEKWMIGIKATSDAIAEVNRQYGTTFRRGIGIVSTHFGFLKLAEQMGVNYEFISYHSYQRRATSHYSMAAGEPNSGTTTTWNIFASLAQFKKPVSLNEINCAETYLGAFDNHDASSALFVDCLHSLKIHLNAWKNNTQLDVESILLYEFRDNPAKEEPENRFGMFWTDSVGPVYTPKPQYYIMKSMLGVGLTTGEENILKAYPGLFPVVLSP